MKTIIRLGTFETNSSSTHSIGIAPAEEYSDWKLGKVIWDEDNKKFIPVEKAKEVIVLDILGDNDSSLSAEYVEDAIKREMEEKLWDIDKLYSYYGFETFENYFSDCDEGFGEEYTTKSGDHIVVFGTFSCDR